MKRVIKNSSSIILTQNLSYIVNGNNSKLSSILNIEQKNYCAYTEKYFSATDLVEIDHFNPTIKGITLDNYENWFLILAKWNRKKAKKWSDFQPILHPTAEDLNKRIWFEDYIFQYQPTDIEAKNLINLLDLNNYELTTERKKYIERLRDLQVILGEEGLKEHLLKFPEQIHFFTAFEVNFGYSPFQ